MIKKMLSVVLLSLVVLMSALVLVPAAHAASHSTPLTQAHTFVVKPNVSGGGCFNGGDSLIKIGACINTSGNGVVNGDAYVTAASNVTSCGAHIYLYSTNGDFLASNDQECFAGRRTYVQPISTWQPFGGSYYSYTIVTYQTRYIPNGNAYANSPTINL